MADISTSMLAAVCLVLTSLILIVAYLNGRMVERKLKAARRELQQLKSRHTRAAYRLDALEKVLGTHTGGVGQRIADCREVAETFLLHAPAAFHHETGLVYRLDALDAFLVSLHEIYQSQGSSPAGLAEPADPRQAVLATSRKADIYFRISREAGLLKMPDSLHSA